MARQVIVGFDGSEHSGVAVDWAAAEAASLGARLTLLSAVVIPVSGVGGRFGAALSPEAVDDLLEGVREQVDERVAELRVARPGLEVDSSVVLGSPAFALVEESQGADLVVVGSRGLGGFTGLVLGSVGTQVATHATCPAVVVRHAAPADHDVVVVGVDGSELSLSALDFAFDIAERRGWRVRAVHTWELPTFDVLAAPIGPPPIDVDSIEEGERIAFAESLAGLRERHPGVPVEERVIRGSTVRSILDASSDAALIVLGTHGRGEFLGTVLGSVSQGVLHKAAVPVAVIGPYRDTAET